MFKYFPHVYLSMGKQARKYIKLEKVSIYQYIHTFACKEMPVSDFPVFLASWLGCSFGSEIKQQHITFEVCFLLFLFCSQDVHIAKNHMPV